MTHSFPTRRSSDLAAAAKSAGLAVAGLSDLSQQQYAEKSSDAVAKAVFAAPRGGIAQIAKSPLGWHVVRSEEHTSELQSLMRISYAVFCLKKKKRNNYKPHIKHNHNIDLHTHTTQQQTRHT